MKHTKGPWFDRLGQSDYWMDVVTENDRIIACVAQITCVPNREERANARLIASAPKMYDYIEYVEAKIKIEEMPLTFKQWKKLNIIATG